MKELKKWVSVIIQILVDVYLSGPVTIKVMAWIQKKVQIRVNLPDWLDFWTLLLITILIVVFKNTDFEVSFLPKKKESSKGTKFIAVMALVITVMVWCLSEVAGVTPATSEKIILWSAAILCEAAQPLILLFVKEE